MVSVRVRLLTEGRHLRAMAVGADDVGGELHVRTPLMV
jgi:hypothetical protein